MPNACAIPQDIPTIAIDASPLDPRSYRALTLPNNLRVVLVSDKDSDKAAAALNVAVGHFSDPDDRPGIAHFCEHMLYMGTKKYPDEGSFRQFLAENGGNSNAYTSFEDTNYHFQITAQAQDENGQSRKRYREALDRFAQMFVAPRFEESAVDREVKAVDSENEKNLQSDGHRLYQLHKSSANPKHPYHKFGTGSCKTLDKEDSRDMLLKFHEQYYSANLMTLTMVAPLDLDLLQQYAVEMFSEVENKGIESPSSQFKNVDIFREQDQMKMYRVSPIKDIRSLTMYWVIPPTHSMFRSKPDLYISHVLGHEGKGTLAAILKKKCWASEVYVGPARTMQFDSFFEVKVELTEEGLKHGDEIISLVHAYINLIKRDGVKEWIYDECKAVADMNFRFRERSEPVDLATHLSWEMSLYDDPKLYLKGPSLFFEYSEEEIRRILDLLSPENLTVCICSKSFEGVACKREKWYDTPYAVEDISAAKVSKWSSAPITEDMGIPPKNEFIATEFDLLGEPLKDDEEDKEGPLRVVDKAGFRVHYKLDRTFERPKAGVYLQFETPLAYYSPRHTIFANLYASLLEESLMEYSYDAQIAGLHYSIDNNYSGIQLVVRGFSHHIDRLLFVILERMKSLKIDPDRFSLVKDQLRREYVNFAKDQPYHHAMYVMNYGMEEPRWHIHAYLDEVDRPDITPATLEDFMPYLLSRMHVEGLVHGNLKREWASELASKIQKIVQCGPLNKSEFVRRRITILPTQETQSYSQSSTNPDDSNSAVEVYYQVGPVDKDLRVGVILELLSDLLDKPAFHELRTKQQLGYMVFSGIRRQENVVGLRIIVQSTVATPDELEERIETFMEDFGGILKATTKEEFENFVNAQKARKLEKERRLSSQGRRFWTEVFHREYLWNRRELEVNELESITLEDVIALYSKCISRKGAERRKIISKVYGGTSDIKKERSHDEAHGIKSVRVGDLDNFRKSLPLFHCGGSL